MLGRCLFLGLTLLAAAALTLHSGTPRALAGLQVTVTTPADAAIPLKPINAILWDRSFLFHDEVVGPLIHTMTRIPSVQLRVYRDSFREGFFKRIAPYYDGSFAPAKQLKHDQGALDGVDVIVMSTGDHELPNILDDAHFLQQYPRLRFIALVHRTQHFSNKPRKIIGRDHRRDRWPNTSRRLETAKALHDAGRLSYLTLSQHVTQNLLSTFAESGLYANGSLPNVETYVPILPYAGNSRSKPAHRLNTAAIQGGLHPKARDYTGIFHSLASELMRHSVAYGYQWKGSSTAQPLEHSKIDSFTLCLVGNSVEDMPLEIPAPLLSVVEVAKDLPYKEYYAKIAEADVLLPAFSNVDLYTTIKASSSIPAGIMSRVPALLSPQEAEAYSYLEYPAVLMRHEGETEFEAITRLRLSKEDQPVWAPDTVWDAYEDRLVQANKRTMISLLYPGLAGTSPPE